ncbi:MAG TPA: WecB/TagA/CpsF family glycosyltransferase [Stackebrandtia sp.]|jgi:N-acetylglucosaminyldiphosphoundecaprenol N-acetyl-beta-D-mannosaminyltransferase|uniref:WecB/TagA/CpsF family glycosyltransferase n=1 Tax=Stackebrandtia sp. TaxID=2023065 RepID=UPI002D54DB24|nr:WecB/TagA/CpsF family glycosyltransferase [Stackebrandtia sp.]HZE39774.1 WecB/TagA/CpsF family glycosyltransferase [Stackebrandtia sp.]
MSTTSHPGRFRCCGVLIDALEPHGAVQALLTSQHGTPRRTHLCNAYTLSLALRDAKYRDLLNAADINFSDGHYVAMVGRKRGMSEMTERVYGPELMYNTMSQGREQGLKHYLYGSSPETVAKLREALEEKLPGVEIVGAESPPFRPLTDEESVEMVRRITSLKPDIVWVGIGTPRQDEFVAEYADRLQATVVPVGAAFDFWSGNKPMAPKFMREHGLEWVYRFATEPRRLWKRYLVGNSMFVYGVVTDKRRSRKLDRAS